MKIEMPKLAYATTALEPVISEQTETSAKPTILSLFSPIYS